MKKKALITGITGQDGSYLAEFLFEKGYEVHGAVRRSSLPNTDRLECSSALHLSDDSIKKCNIFLHYSDLADMASIFKVLKKIEPDEIYNLGAQSDVGVSFEIPEYTAEIDALGTLRLLETVRLLELDKKTKIYQASTSELFGVKSISCPDENTSFYPRSPYAVAKMYAFWITKNYRETYGIFACNGILFNHESERRGENFVTRKITTAAAKIAKGKQDILYLGNLDAKRDWGYAKDYVECMWLMLQQNNAEDYVVATGQAHSVREFAEIAFREAGFEIVWKGKALNEKGIDKKTGKVLIEINPQYFRPQEVDHLCGNPAKAVKNLGWNPQKTSFEQLVKLMVQNDLKNY
ncbi:MAG: GDP-mannose 4,6-dehydratase [Elusimicrobia bacterium]|nr:GDP-mannose 4,6-dehydratase [Elusimicrobiota bacterium]